MKFSELVGATVLVFLSLGEAHPADLSFNVCSIGANDYHKYLSKCGSDVDGLFPCYTGDQIGQMICNISTPQGPVKVPYSVSEGSDVAGGQCGIATFTITCHVPAEYKVIYDIQHDGPEVSCGQCYPSVAAPVCRGIKNPTNNYGWFFDWYQAGGQCGSTALRVLCYN